MSIKQSILQLLEEKRERDISGEKIGKSLGISRSAVWKSVKSLKEEGHEIVGVSNRGYRLKESSDLLSTERIRFFLSAENKDIPIILYKEIDSTNQEAKKRLADGQKETSVIISESQTQGRGRMGRRFFSPQNTGIYMSLILCPDVYSDEAVLITTAASVAVSRAIKTVTHKETQIKWVNDLYLEGEKICGILTEAMTNVETGLVESIVLGIGINFISPKEEFPEEIKNCAGALFEKKPPKVTRNHLVGEIINEVLKINLKNHDFLEEYKRRSMVLGKNITVQKNDQASYFAQAIEISDDGGLVIKNDQNEIETLNSGEISIRMG